MGSRRSASSSNSGLNSSERGTGSDLQKDKNIILNPKFEDGLKNWSGLDCKVLLQSSMGKGKVLPMPGTKFFASATKRTQTSNGIQQDITRRVQKQLAYEVDATVRIFGNISSSEYVEATLLAKTTGGRKEYIAIAKVKVTNKDWMHLKGKFMFNSEAANVSIYLEGPPAGTDILLNSLIVKRATKARLSDRPVIKDVYIGVNIIANSNLKNGTEGWFSNDDNCSLSVRNGAPRTIPPLAGKSLRSHEPLSNMYIIATNRTKQWMGPAQIITDKVILYATYQVSGWVQVGPGATSPQEVNVALEVDGQWVNIGQVEIPDNKWHEISGSFRIEKRPAKVMVYVYGPAANIDLMVAGLQIFPVNRLARFEHLKRETDKVRKRDIILKFNGLCSDSLVGSSVIIRQIQNNFPFGSCLSRSNIDNKKFVDFFVKNFNWAVFENELKWYWTEPRQGKSKFGDADQLLDFCIKHKIQVRGHCLFWEVKKYESEWVQALKGNDLFAAVQNRLKTLLGHYKGKFKHYDVNNEMLHGSFYQDRLGKDIRATMFKTANELDPSSILFVNDYNVEDGYDAKSSPEKYIEHIRCLLKQKAPVGGIGIQGHIDFPIGPIVCSALDKLGHLGIPIWFTEIDVSSNNEHVRADDLEVMLREAFAHPAVEGIMLWGFMELNMFRKNSHLVNAEGGTNEAGKRYLALKQEWLSHARGNISDRGEFSFRGFHGSYKVEVVTKSKKVTKTFSVPKGKEPLVITIPL